MNGVHSSDLSPSSNRWQSESRRGGGGAGDQAVTVIGPAPPVHLSPPRPLVIDGHNVRSLVRISGTARVGAEGGAEQWTLSSTGLQAVPGYQPRSPYDLRPVPGHQSRSWTQDLRPELSKCLTTMISVPRLYIPIDACKRCYPITQTRQIDAHLCPPVRSPARPPCQCTIPI